MKRIFEFVCPEGHITERLVDSEVRTVLCSCFSEAERIVSAPQIKLEGITGAFPGAYDRWERVRAEKLAVERKQKASHGEE
jgi:hypothetical protein